jgi:cytochrome c oxidase accessory protein FixG
MTTPREDEKDAFRDRLGIVSTEGTRNWISPRQPEGRFYRARTAVSIVLLTILFGTPFLRTGGHPFMLFDITERTFIVFGQTFGPHDFILFAFMMISTIVFVFLFTVVFGRIFCGWICPQTIFLEMVFRRLDYLIEGGPRQQRRLRESTWTVEKIRKKGLKHGLYFVVAFAIANTLLAWVIGTEKLFVLMSDPPSQHLSGLFAILAFTMVFHWIFGWFREYACILVCPYGRLQGVMLDRNSIVIAYDFMRGEPRGKMRKGEERVQGDCIDCRLCVDVCPTGIDIRNGTQLECVNCTACVDACDGVMDSVGRKRGLIRWDSIEGIEKHIRKIITPRSIGYAIVLTMLVSLLAFLVVTRKDVDVTILRTPGTFFQEQTAEQVSNIYDLKLLNKTFDEFAVDVRLTSSDGSARLLGGPLVALPQRPVEAKLVIVLPRSRLERMSTPIRVEIVRGDQVVSTVETAFLGPVPKKKVKP